MARSQTVDFAQEAVNSAQNQHFANSRFYQFAIAIDAH